MNFCIICPDYPTTEGLGGYFFVEQIVNQFAKQGHNCVVIAPINIATKYGVHWPKSDKFESRAIEDGCAVKIIRPSYYGRNVLLFGVTWAAWAARKSIERSIRKYHLKIDVFYCHFFRCGTLVWRYASKHGIPVFVATGESVINKLKSPSFGFSIDKFSEYISGVISVSTKNKEEAMSLGYTVDSKCIVLPNGVDLSLFKPIDRNICRNKLGINESDFVVICVGNISERKGQDRLLKAVDELNCKNNYNIKLYLIGQGDICHSGNLTFKGFVDHTELPVYLNAADIYVIPTRWEGCCNSIIEAMACGLPIISSDRSFNRDILDKTNSILIEPDDVEQIASAIQMLYEDKDYRYKLAKNAWQTTRELSVEMRSQRIISFILSKIS